MTTAADYEPELVDALNLLIEDERASVEMEVALASGATEYVERDTLARMGADDINSCETLRTEMERAGLPVTPQINGVVFEVLGAERYDDRLRAFAHHQRIVADRASDLLESNLDGAIRDALVNIVATHQHHIEWANQRADTFAATRLMEFGLRQRDQPADAEAMPPPAPDVATPPAELLLPDIPAVEAQEEATQISEAPAGETPSWAETPALPLEETQSGETQEALAPNALEAALEITAPEEAAPAAAEEAAPEAITPEAPAQAPAEPSVSRPRRGRPRKAVPPAE